MSYLGFVEGLYIDAAPKTTKRMCVYAVRSDRDYGENYLLLNEGISDRTIEVTEVSEEGSVNDLRLKNNSSRRLLCLDGETLIGAKQNRTLNLSVLVEHASEIIIPVSCVEQGRWSRRSSSFSHSGRSMFGSARARMMEDVDREMGIGNEPRARQGMVWEEVDRKLGGMEVPSPTRDMDEAFTSYEDDVASMLEETAWQEGQVGAIFSVDGVFVGMDIFSHPEVCRKSYQHVFKGYALDAIDKFYKPMQSNIKTPGQALLVLSVVKLNEHDAIGLGKELRFKERGLIGSSLLVDDEIAHLSVFPHFPDDSREM